MTAALAGHCPSTISSHLASHQGKSLHFIWLVKDNWGLETPVHSISCKRSHVYTGQTRLFKLHQAEETPLAYPYGTSWQVSHDRTQDQLGAPASSPPNADTWVRYLSFAL
jgi:hypothetical protein